MRLQIVGVGRLKDGPERSLTDDYLGRTQPLARQLEPLAPNDGIDGGPAVVLKPTGRRAHKFEHLADMPLGSFDDGA